MSDEKITKDIAIPLGQSENGNLVLARIQGTAEKPERIMLGELLPLEDGKPIMDEVIKLTPSEDRSHLNVETLLEDPYKAQKEQARGATGSKTFSFPSKRYQDNWDRIFGSGKKSKFSDLN